MRIFALDDERAALMLAEDIVAETVPDARFTAFQNPDAFLAAIQADAPDIALLDIEMPNVTGLDMARRIASVAPNVNIIFSTGYAQYKADAMDVFASAYILKPISSEKLRVALQHLRHPVAETRRLKIVTKPRFQALVDGRPIQFARSRTNDLLAYLVFLQGKDASAREIRVALFGEVAGLDDKTNSYFNHIKSDLEEVFESLGLSDILVFGTRRYAVNTRLFDCDWHGETVNGPFMAEMPWGKNK